MSTHVALIVAPVVLGLLPRLQRRPQRMLADLTHAVRDVITLRMALRDTDPDQRADLLNAHCAWRTETPPAVARRPRRPARQARGR